MSSYLSSPNDSRNNCDSRYHEPFFFLFPLRRRYKSKASSMRRALRHIFYRGTHSGRYRAYCLLNRDLYAFAIFPSRDWTRQGWLEKSKCMPWLDDTHWNAPGYTQCEHLSQRSPRGKFYSTCDVVRYHRYYFPRIFFVISANCTHRRPVGGFTTIPRYRETPSYRLSFHLNKCVLILSSDVSGLENYAAR